MTWPGCENKQKTVAVTPIAPFVDDAQMDTKTIRWEWFVHFSYVSSKNRFLTRSQYQELETSIFCWHDNIHKSFTSLCHETKSFRPLFPTRTFHHYVGLERKYFHCTCLFILHTNNFSSTFQLVLVVLKIPDGCFCWCKRKCMNWNQRRSKLLKVPNSHHQNNEINDRLTKQKKHSMQWQHPSKQ